MNALVVVDVQNDFLPGGALAVADGDAVIAVANGLMRQFKLVVATQDWHPANHASFAANHLGTKVGDIIDLNGLEQILWPVHCVQSTHGAELAASLDKSRIQRIFHKGIDPGIDSYSALYDNAHRRSTGLAEFLHEQGVSDVYIVGLATDYCVKFSVIDALGEGFTVHVVEDGCRGVNLKAGDDRRAIEEMRAKGAKIVNSAQAGI